MSDFNIIKFEIWNEWEFGQSGEKVESSSKKWVNTTNTFPFRPSQTTIYNNLFLSGAHTKVSVDIWSMEGAVESGKIVSKEICKRSNINPNKIQLYSHDKILPLKLISIFDDVLYRLGLPDIIDLILLIIIVSLTFY